MVSWLKASRSGSWYKAKVAKDHAIVASSREPKFHGDPPRSLKAMVWEARRSIKVIFLFNNFAHVQAIAAKPLGWNSNASMLQRRRAMASKVWWCSIWERAKAHAKFARCFEFNSSRCNWSDSMKGRSFLPLLAEDQTICTRSWGFSALKSLLSGRERVDLTCGSTGWRLGHDMQTLWAPKIVSP